MTLFLPDPRAESEHPAHVREVVGGVRASGQDCVYAGTVGGTDVYLVGAGHRRARLAVDRERIGIELWADPPDPNGAPFAWDYDHGTGAQRVASVVAGAFEAE